MPCNEALRFGIQPHLARLDVEEMVDPAVAYRAVLDDLNSMPAFGAAPDTPAAPREMRSEVVSAESRDIPVAIKACTVLVGCCSLALQPELRALIALFQ